MSTTTLIPTYPIDITGQAESNRVVERVNLSVRQANEFQIAIPRCAPFYHRGVSIRKIETNEELQYGIDYYFAGACPELTHVTEYQQLVFGIIVFLDHHTGGEYEITYQTFGGENILSDTEYVEVITNRRFNPFYRKWSEITEKPIDYPPSAHGHPTSHTHSYGDLINSFNTMTQTLASLYQEFRPDDQSYLQILTELMAHGKVILDLMHKVDSLDSLVKVTKQGQTQALIDQVGELAKRLTNTETSLGDRITELDKREVKRHNDGVRTDATINAKIKTLETNLGAQSQTQSRDNQSRVQDISGLRTAINDFGTNLTALETRLRTASQTMVDNAIGKLKKVVSVNQNNIAKLQGNHIEKATASFTTEVVTPTVKADTLTPKSDHLTVDLRPGQRFRVSRRNGHLLEVIHAPDGGTWVQSHVNLIMKNGTVIAPEGLVGTRSFRYDANDDFWKLGGSLRADDVIVDIKPGTTRGLKQAVWRIGDVVDNYIFTKPYYASTLNRLDYAGPVAYGLTNIGNQPFFGHGYQFASRNSDNTYLFRMLAFDKDNPFDVYIQSWDTRKQYLGRKKLGVNIAQSLPRTPSPADRETVPSMALISTFANRVGTVGREKYIRETYGKAPSLSQSNGFCIGDKLRFIPDAAGSSDGHLIQLQADTTGKQVFKFSQDIHVPNFRVTSDRRVKSDLVPIEDAGEKLNQLKGYTYRLHGGEARHAGLIAQDVERVLPEAVRTDAESGLKAVDYPAIIALLVNQVNTLTEEVNRLKAENNHVAKKSY